MCEKKIDCIFHSIINGKAVPAVLMVVTAAAVAAVANGATVTSVMYFIALKAKCECVALFYKPDNGSHHHHTSDHGSAQLPTN